jgi:preprotein translocase subunit Sss1
MRPLDLSCTVVFGGVGVVGFIVVVVMEGVATMED